MPEITNVGTNIAEKSTVIWNVADMLRGPFKPHEYGLVILPMTVMFCGSITPALRSIRVLIASSKIFIRNFL